MYRFHIWPTNNRATQSNCKRIHLEHVSLCRGWTVSMPAWYRHPLGSTHLGVGVEPNFPPRDDHRGPPWLMGDSCPQGGGTGFASGMLSPEAEVKHSTHHITRIYMAVKSCCMTLWDTSIPPLRQVVGTMPLPGLSTPMTSEEKGYTRWTSSAISTCTVETKPSTVQRTVATRVCHYSW
jgi:hypothetical protein